MACGPITKDLVPWWEGRRKQAGLKKIMAEKFTNLVNELTLHIPDVV